MADTLATNVAETTQEIIAATIALIPQKAPMPNLVTRITIPKGHDRVEIPRVNSTPTVQTPTEGDELVTSSQFDLTSTTIQPTLRAIKVRVTERATYFSRDNVISLVSEQLSRIQAQDIDTDLTAEFANFGSGNDVGTTNTDLTVAVWLDAVNKLDSNTYANGGPAPMPRYGVLSPLVYRNLITDLGAQGTVPEATATGQQFIPAGISQDIIENYYRMRLGGVPLFIDGYMTENGSSDFICGMFSKEALHLAISKDWDIKTYDESEWIGVTLRCVADYNSGVGAFPLWGVQITADGA